MKRLAVQLQPNRLPGLDVTDVVARLRRLATAAQITKDEGSITIGYNVLDPSDLWALVREELTVAGLAEAAIVVCEGRHGWDDYLLLHHFDPTVPLDQLEDGGEELVKVFVELHDCPIQTESFWAKPLGNDLFELRNSPWYAFDLHSYDIVRAMRSEPDEKARIIEVVRPSGHKTLRVFFPSEVSEADRLEMLRSLQQWRGFYENCDGRLYAVDVEPDGNYKAVCDQLWEWEQAGRLFYETGDSGD